jgi:hypothetical protein
MSEYDEWGLPIEKPHRGIEKAHKPHISEYPALLEENKKWIECCRSRLDNDKNDVSETQLTYAIEKQNKLELEYKEAKKSVSEKQQLVRNNRWEQIVGVRNNNNNTMTAISTVETEAQNIGREVERVRREEQKKRADERLEMMRRMKKKGCPDDDIIEFMEPSEDEKIWLLSQQK